MNKIRKGISSPMQSTHNTHYPYHHLGRGTLCVMHYFELWQLCQRGIYSDKVILTDRCPKFIVVEDCLAVKLPKMCLCLCLHCRQQLLVAEFWMKPFFTKDAEIILNILLPKVNGSVIFHSWIIFVSPAVPYFVSQCVLLFVRWYSFLDVAFVK